MCKCIEGAFSSSIWVLRICFVKGYFSGLCIWSWVREIYFWESGCKNFLHSEYFSLVVFLQWPCFFSGFRIFHINPVLYDWCILHLIFLLICCFANCLEWSWEETQFLNTSCHSQVRVCYCNFLWLTCYLLSSSFLLQSQINLKKKKSCLGNKKIKFMHWTTLFISRSLAASQP